MHVRRFAAFWQKILQNSEAYKIHKKHRNCLHNKPREKAHVLQGPVVQKPVSLNKFSHKSFLDQQKFSYLKVLKETAM